MDRKGEQKFVNCSGKLVDGSGNVDLDGEKLDMIADSYKGCIYVSHMM